MTKTVLIANRGEIAVRAVGTLRRLGMKSVAVYSDADRNSRHVTAADVAIPLGGQTALESYLRGELIIKAAQETGAEAIFPGYGFLSESAEFAEACENAGLAFLGPTPTQIRDFGLKHRARELAALANVPLSPGSGLLEGISEALTFAAKIGYPVMLKSTAGGGGIGLTRCNNIEELEAAFESVKRLGRQFFKDSGVFLERFVDGARHVEVQILGDGAGTVVALGERDCSLQRRNQKVLEETPAPGLSEATRARLFQAAVSLGESVNYRSAGTVEFIFDSARDEFYFLEVNTRLQVEHPITEAVTGLDLVELMLRVGFGDSIDFSRLRRPPSGAAMEVRIYAEDPLKNFQPSPGTLTDVHFPDFARVDTFVATGTEVTPYYDPMIAKVIVHGATRSEALARLKAALDATRLGGIATNLAYLKQVIREEKFERAELSTGFLGTFSFTPRAVEILEPGPQTTIQDYPGRVGYWDIGVPPSGPMDDFSFRLSQRLVGNAPKAAGLECTLQGPSLKFHADAIVAIAGGKVNATLDGRPFPSFTPGLIKAGETLKVGKILEGCRCYIAVSGGFDVPLYLGSRSTFVLGQFGGHGGRYLRAGDVLSFFETDLAQANGPEFPLEKRPEFTGTWEIGVLDGPHGAPDFFEEESISELFASDYEVHYNASRLGVRLLGPKPRWARKDGGEAGLHPSNIHDCEYALGSLNFTGDSPVILTHDGPSLGGFVCPVTIARAELWKVGQLRPGDKVRFSRLDWPQARALEAAQETLIEKLGKEPRRPKSVAAKSSPILETLPEIAGRPLVTYRQAGDSYILLEYGENVLDLALRMRIYLLMEALRTDPIKGIAEASPGVRSLQLRYDPNEISQQELLRRLVLLEEHLPAIDDVKIPSRVVHLPMAFEDSSTLAAVQRYQESVRAEAPWLPNNVDFIQRINGLVKREDVRDIIYQTSYLVLGIGDVYLGAPCAVPIDPRHRLLTSKYNPARTFTAEGTVGIGGVYMCIYGMDSPGGYQLVGRTLPIWNKFLTHPQFEQGKPWLLRFFDQVRFYPVSESELIPMREAFREGRLPLQIEETEFDYAAHSAFLADNAASIEAFRTQQKAAFEVEVARWQADEVLASARAQSARPEPALTVDGDPIRAGLRGNLWKLLVEVGQRVQEGEVVAIVEAMKMELSITSPRAGVVKALVGVGGSPVGPDDVVVLLEADDGESDV